MGQMVFEPTQSWELGAHTSPAMDLGPKGSFAVGENTVLLRNTGQSSVIGQREGWRTQNPLAIPGDSAVIGQYNYIRSTGNLTNTSYHLLVSSNGRFDKLMPDMSIAPADPAIPTGGFTPGFYPPSFATMSNLCFIANGMDHIHVFNGTRHWGAGADAPVAPTVVDSGTGVQPADDYSFLITYYDEPSGYETSASPPTLILKTANPFDQFFVSWLAPPTGPHSHPFTHTRVYMRQNSKQTEHFLVSDATGTIGQVPLPTVSLLVNISQDQINNLTILAPDEFENNPPPEGIIGVRSHVSRLFCHDGSKVYYSNLGKPEAFDPDNFFLVNTDDGQKIMALHAAHEVLIVFKKDSVWALYGEDPATWTPRMISPSVGCVNERSIMYIEGASYWWSESGPMKWAGTGPVENLALGRLDDQVALGRGLSTPSITPDASQESVGAIGTVDVVNQRLLWAVPALNNKQNNILLPYKYRFNQWESTKWFGIDAASLVSVQDATSTPYVYLGSYKGQVFGYGGVVNDGTHIELEADLITPKSGKLLSGKIAVTPTDPQTITVETGLSPGETLLTQGPGLTERYLYVNDGTARGWQIKRIGSNTANTITLAEGVEFDRPVNELWTWSVGTIGFRVGLPWQSFTAPFIRKRLEYGYFWVGSNVNTAEMEVALFRNYNLDLTVREFRLPLEATGLVWDEGKWEEAYWGSGTPTTRHRRRLAKGCFSYRWVFQQYDPDVDAVIFKVDTRAETQVDKP